MHTLPQMFSLLDAIGLLLFSTATSSTATHRDHFGSYERQQIESAFESTVAMNRRKEILQGCNLSVHQRSNWNESEVYLIRKKKNLPQIPVQPEKGSWLSIIWEAPYSHYDLGRTRLVLNYKPSPQLSGVLKAYRFWVCCHEIRCIGEQVEYRDHWGKHYL